MTGCRFVAATPPGAGAIAIVQLAGDVEPVLEAVSGVRGWPPGRARLVPLAGIDEGVAARLSESVAQLMPHGGRRVVQRLCGWLAAAGARPDDAPDPLDLYPEAADRFEALALAAAARAASPAAIDLLLEQPRRWRGGAAPGEADLARSRRLNRLIVPPRVVVAGPANVGKSTLSNALLGRAMSIAADAPGTTRDYTSARIELAGLVVDWHDTPGLHDAGDAIERAALEIAGRLMTSADCLIAMTDAGHDWPRLPRPADLKLGAKADVQRRADADLCVSAVTGEGLAGLVAAVRDRLVPPQDLAHPGPWVFDERLVPYSPIVL